MKLKRIKLKNFLSFEEADLVLPEKGLLLIEGMDLDNNRSIGAGKTALVVDSLLFGLYGESVKSGNLDEFVRYDQDYLNVTLEFDKLTVIRERLKNSKKTIITVNYQGNVYGGEFGEVRETQRVLQSILNLSPKCFETLVIFSSALEPFVDLKGYEKLNVLTEILDLKKFDLASDKAKEKAKNTQLEMTKLESKINTLNETIKTFDLEKIKQKYETWESERQSAIKTKEQQIEKYLKELNNLKCLDIEKHKTVVEKLQRDYDQLNLDTKVLWVEITNLSDKKREIKALGSQCPLCLQPVSKQHKTHVENELEKEIQIKNKELKKLSIKTEKVKEALDLAKKELQELEKQNTSIMNRKMHLSMSIASLNKEIEQLKNSQNPYQELLEKTKQNLDDYKKDLEQAYRDLRQTSKLYTIFTFWKSGFKKLKKLMMEKTLETLNYYANNYLRFLTNNQFFMHFSIEKGEINFQIYRKNQQTSFGLLSEGEKQLHRLSCSPALGHVIRNLKGIDFNFRIFDEPLSGLDEASRQRVFQLLQEMSKDYLVIVIAHETEFKDYFHQVLTVEKKNGISVLR